MSRQDSLERDSSSYHVIATLERRVAYTRNCMSSVWFRVRTPDFKSTSTARYLYSPHSVEQFVQSNFFCWSLSWKVTIKSLKSKLGILGCHFIECGASKNTFSSFCKMGSSCSFGTSVGTVESPLCAQQFPGRVLDESSIKGIIQSQNDLFNFFNGRILFFAIRFWAEGNLRIKT